MTEEDKILLHCCWILTMGSWGLQGSIMSSLLHDLYQDREVPFFTQKSPQKELSPWKINLFFIPGGGECFLDYIAAFQKMLFMSMYISTSEHQAGYFSSTRWRSIPTPIFTRYMSCHPSVGIYYCCVVNSGSFQGLVRYLNSCNQSFCLLYSPPHSHKITSILTTRNFLEISTTRCSCFP